MYVAHTYVLANEIIGTYARMTKVQHLDAGFHSRQTNNPNFGFSHARQLCLICHPLWVQFNHLSIYLSIYILIIYLPVSSQL